MGKRKHHDVAGPLSPLTQAIVIHQGVNHVRKTALRTFALDTSYGTELKISVHLLDPPSVYTAGPGIDLDHLHPAFSLPFASQSLTSGIRERRYLGPVTATHTSRWCYSSRVRNIRLSLGVPRTRLRIIRSPTLYHDCLSSPQRSCLETILLRR